MGKRASKRKWVLNKEGRHKQFVRSQLINKYGSKCVECGEELNGSEITLDHIKPISKGGETSFENCQIMCQPCNNKKGNNYGMA